jgi:two-component system, OmpR family, sensor histidine kinase KdpD
MAETGDRADALLDLATRESRGKLKIFLGAAPGVGKTYTMLGGARRAKDEGRDVLIGIVETHGRAETAALLEGLEVLPRKAVDYRGHSLMEFDLDEALARKPSLIVVDELAHSNAPDSRHPKRYQDVAELLSAGIDVWTALNIQHIESLSDVVAAISGVKVRELVPDTIIENADDVVLVDITPDELIARLKEGKVYLPDNARRAADNFLQPGNITALRDLALRRTAQRVDDQMTDYLRQKAIEGPWPTAERVLVCVGGSASSERAVRAAARAASALNAPWIAVHVELPSAAGQTDGLTKHADDALALAERLGAETRRLTAQDPAGEILKIAQQENITQIMVGRSRPRFLKRVLGKSLPDEILRRASGISVHILTGDQAGAGMLSSWHPKRIEVNMLLPAFAWVAGATGVGLSIQHIIKLPNISMVYLAAVLLCAVSFGTWSAVIAAVLSFLAYNFFFINPVYTLTVASPHELLSLVMFLLVAVITGGLAGRVKEQSLGALRRIRQIQTLLDMSRKLSAAVNIDDIMWIAATQAAAAAQGQAIILLKRQDELDILAAMPPEDSLGTADWAAARWSVDRVETAGWGSATLPNALYQFRPLRTPHGVVGAVGIRPASGSLTNEADRMVDAIADQTSLAVERTLLSTEASDARATAEGEKLRSALLSSLSHDLRTPLSSIVGSVSTLRSLGDRIPEAGRSDLLVTIEEEATRLSRFVANLLDMTRLEAGAVEINSVAVDVSDVVAAAVRRAKETWPGRPIQLNLASSIPTVQGDAGLMEQLVFNLVENAQKYSPPDGPICISVDRAGAAIRILVEDEGPGIPKEDLERVFEKFYRVKGGDGRPPGTGLGLAICRAIASAMGGSIHAESPLHEGHGTRIVIELPVRAPQ